MIKRFVKMSFHSQYIDEFTSIFKTSRHSIKGFAGCKHVELLQDELHPTTFFTFSIWESEEHLNAYRNSELFSRVWASTKKLFNDKPQAWTVKLLDFD
jgi:heme-degrading monooxygenase HmoA